MTVNQRNDVKRKLKSLNSEKQLETWIDSLPFPSASILWNYYAIRSNEKKVEYLFFFFESLSEFLCIVILSVYFRIQTFIKLININGTLIQKTTVNGIKGPLLVNGMLCIQNYLQRQDDY